MDAREKRGLQRKIMNRNTMREPAIPQTSIRLDSSSVNADELDPAHDRARHVEIRPGNVFVEPGVLEDYAEVDPSLGLNVFESILSALAGQRAACPVGVPEESVTISLLRREDAQAVELNLQINHVCRHGREFLYLRKFGERELALQRD